MTLVPFVLVKPTKGMSPPPRAPARPSVQDQLFFFFFLFSLSWTYFIKYVLNHSLDAAHSLDRMSSVWARPTHSINCRVNGIEAHSLDKLSSQWAGPFAWQVTEWMGQMLNRHFIEWVGLCLIHSTVYQLSGSGAWGIIQRMKEFAAKNYGKGDLFNWIKQSRSWNSICKTAILFSTRSLELIFVWYS